MCARALQLKWPIIQLLQSEPELMKELLSQEDWGYLENITNFLKPFRECTKTSEGIFDSIDRVLPCMEFLLEHLETAKEIYAGNAYMAPRVDAAWAKLEKYYMYTDDTVVYVAATVLNLMCKWHYFENRWTTPTLRGYLATNQARF